MQSVRPDQRRFNLDRAVLAFAGGMILLSVVLVRAVSPTFWLLTAFIGFNLLQASLTGFCPAAIMFRRLGLRQGCAFE